ALANEFVRHDVAYEGDVVASNAPTAKVIAASGGSAIGGSLGTIFTWIIVSKLEPPPLPGDVHTAIAAVTTALCGALMAGLLGYFTRPQAHTRVICDERRRPRIARHIG
ncbi:MAG TPA: hypothetical protein VGN21_10740, partial [Stellaceae bacterium]